MKIYKKTITDEDIEIDILYRLNEWADGNKGFRCAFFEEIDSFYRKKGYITYDQFEALERIYEKNKSEYQI
jgi:hypothetical protein